MKSEKLVISVDYVVTHRFELLYIGNLSVMLNVWFVESFPFIFCELEL